ncbi:hypothetical protein O9X98_08540 [Agrobacterium salinitolerans]|nr:hypothetical protein [Agrobacterium salinitolerans]
MENEDPNNEPLVPLHGSKVPFKAHASFWGNVQTLVYYDQPLMIAIGSAEEPYLGFAGVDQVDKYTTYFVIPFTVAGIDAFLAGKLTVEGAIKLAGGDVYYTEDLKYFRRVPLADMPEDDRVVLQQSGPDYEPIMERRPVFA